VRTYLQGEHPRPGEGARDRQLERLCGQDFGLAASLTIPANELRAHDSSHDERSRTPLERLADVLANALERVEPLPLDLGRQHLDFDPRQVLGQRLAPGRFSTGMRFDFLLDIGGGQCRIELGRLPLSEHHRQYAQRQLRLVVRKVLGLGREDAELQLSAPLHRLQVQGAVLLALTLGGRDPLLQLVESLHDLRDVGHIDLDARYAILDQREI
jgi:hypothetical protein